MTFSFTSYRSCYLCQIFLLHFLLHSRCSALDLRYLHWENLEFLLSICVTYEVISLCSVDAAHMHRRDFDDQMWIYLWSRFMLLAYASHRAWDFSNPTPGLECARHMPFLKFNPTSRIFSDPGSTFPTPRPAVTRVWKKRAITFRRKPCKIYYTLTAGWR